MGGQPALVAAARHPDRVERVVVMGSLVAHDAPTSWEIRLLRRRRINEMILRYLPRAVFLRARATFLRRHERLDADVRADMWRCFQRDDVRRFLARMCAGYEASLPGLAAVYRTIGVPVLALWPERDAHFPIVHGEWLARAVASARLEIVAGAGHWMPFTMAEAVASRIIAFAGARAAVDGGV